MTTIMYVSAILAVVIILTIIGVLSRYRRCKPNQVLVVYGKTGGEKKSAKLYHGGAAFVLPIIQSYDVLSMEPMQIDCKLTGALSSQNIRVDVPTTITVAISTNPEIMQNAAERLLGMDTPILRSPSSTRWLISGKKLLENRLKHLSTLISEISRYLTAVRTVPVISLTMLSRPSLRHWESLISFRLQIL